jgi:poly(glycerol-phosphate) alpha-glucosyltransferase
LFMNVVHIFPYSPRRSGGVNNAILSFIACHRAKGINAVGLGGLDEQLPRKDFEFPMAEVGALRGLSWPVVLSQLGVKPGETVVNFHSINYHYRSLTQGLRRLSIPYVLSEHGHLSFQNPARWLKKFIYLNCADREPRKAAGLHVLTRMGYEGLKFLVPGYRGSILLQGNLANFPNKAQMPAAANRNDYGLPSGAFILLFLGRIDVWTKSLDRVVEALAMLPAKRFHLVIAGPDSQGGQAKLQLLSQRLGCDDRLHFIGPVYGDKKRAVLRMADLFVSPSRKDAFSLSLIEAIASGLPVLTSTRINLARQLEEADAALLVPPKPGPLAEAMKQLEADAQLREGLNRRGKAWLEINCDPARAGVRFLDFYQSVLEGRPKRITG